MEQSKPSAALFDVYLRLRPSASAAGKERFLDVEDTRHAHQLPTHITIKPPADDKRKRAVERFGFTRVFEERCGQRELLESIGILPILEGVLGQPGREGRDGLLATLGVTGSGKSHTILGSKSQRGITQLALDVLYRHTAPTLVDADYSPSAFSSLCQADVSEGHLLTASNFLDSIYYGGDVSYSRAATPGMETSFMSMPAGPRRNIPRVSNLANHPPVDDIEIAIDRDAEYAVVVSMYEVHNDRIYDLLASSSSSAGNKQQQQQQQAKRRALLFKSTEKSPDRKVVAGLKKVVCSTLEEALLVLETGLTERRVAGTGSNAVSSRSHGFFNIEVKKRARSTRGIPVSGPWTSSTLTIVDLAGSERARAAKTAGATLAEAGKINESLMYLGQCMQLQADQAQGLTNANVVPFRQCKLTELLFSNSLGATGGKETGSKKAPQKAVMIVTADPLGDYNATSQILRYSALAREVTVPRVPSVTSQIASAPVMPSNPHGHPTGRATPSNNTAAVQEELEEALATIASLRSELEVSQLLLQEETQRRQDAEASWKVAETRIEEVEAEVREEMCEEFESRLALEQRRWRAARDAEMDAQDLHLDRKLEVLTQGMTIYEDETAEKENLVGFEDDGEGGESDAEREDDVLGKAKGGRPNGFRGANADVARLAEIEAENAVLREKVANAERSKEAQRSPSKKMRVLKTPSKGWRGSGVELWE
ncbi:P-loop containing nucleoside triphosphate hydrolase protein [Hortaea werneckii]|nr:P-loop containing nucleoside triphosphate hydrolase protein [Hortaea werneckii]KAI7317824.1 P-loop containing nucleoside triphosphate hydrolase protein [Hortaea werneckii]